MKTISRRQMLRGTVMSAGAVLMAACVAPAAPQAPAAAPEATKAVEAPTAAPEIAKAGVTIDYWTPGEDLGAYKAVLEKYQQNTGMKVNQVYVPLSAGTQASEKLLASIAGGTPPDVAFFDRFLVASWAARNALTDITDLCKRDSVKQEEFLPQAWAEATYCGKQWGLPLGTGSRGLYYNRTAFTDAGLDPDKPPTNFAEIDAAHEKLLKGNAADGYTRLGFVPWYPWVEWMIYLWGMTFEGADVWDFTANKCTVNSDPFLKTADWMVQYAKKYQVAAMDAFGGQFGSGPQDPFGNGLICMYQTGEWMLLQYKQYFPDLQYDVAIMPGPDKATGRSLMGGWSDVIPRGAKHLEEAWQFTNYVSSEEGQYITYRDAGDIAATDIPSCTKVVNDPSIALAKHPKAGTFIKAIPNVYIRPPIPEGQLLFEEMGKASDLIVHQKVDPKEALDGVTKRVDEAMAKWKCGA